MMKRGLALILAGLMLLIPLASRTEVRAELNQKMATRSGPGTKYTGEKTYPITTKITVLSQVETFGTVWYQVEFVYNSKPMRVYTGKKRVDAFGDIPWESVDYTEDRLLCDVVPSYGPGEEYARRTKSVAAGTVVRVFWTEGNWAVVEYKEGKEWVRAYVEVSNLANTEASVARADQGPVGGEGQDPVAFNIIDREKMICVDYYGNQASYRGYDENYALMVGMLPVMEYFDGVPCIRRHTYVYSGPSTNYWRRYLRGDYAYTGTLDTNLRVYGKEDGWIMIRYPSDMNGGYRYGWIIPEAIPASDLARVQKVDFAYLSAVTTRDADMTDDPDLSLERITSFGKGVNMTALAFLDMDREWVYCEYEYYDYNAKVTARGFVPARSLKLR